MRGNLTALVGRSHGMFKTVPLLVVMGTIFYLSHQPGDSFDLPDIILFDKLLHTVAYGVLATAFLFAAPLWLKRKSLKLTAVVAAIFCFLYGISDEYHQSFIPGRFVSGWDVAADVFGASVVACFWRRRIRKGEEKV